MLGFLLALTRCPRWGRRRMVLRLPPYYQPSSQLSSPFKCLKGSIENLE